MSVEVGGEQVTRGCGMDALLSLVTTFSTAVLLGGEAEVTTCRCEVNLGGEA